MTRIQDVWHKDEARWGGWSPTLNGSVCHVRWFRETRVRREELGVGWFLIPGRSNEGLDLGYEDGIRE